MAKLSPEARAWLAAARDGDDPTPEQRARADAAARIALAMHGMTDMPPLAGAAPQHPPAAASAGKLGSALVSKLVAAAGLAALLAGGSIAWRALQPAPAAHSTRPLAAEPAKAVFAAPPGPLPAPAGEHPAAAPAARTRDDGPRAGAARRRDDGQPAGATRRRDLRTANAHAARTHAPDSDLQAEVALLTAANAAIRGEHMNDASRLLADHAGRFPRGALREERRALELIVLCSHGASARAGAAVQSFLRSAPQSVLAQRVRAACKAQDGAP